MIKPWCSVLLGLFLGSAIALPVNAQISIDRTTNTTLTPTDNGIRIDEGNRSGVNLFHSFREFSVLNGTEAFFNNPNDIVNIFSRVTGGNISSIDGLIRANGTANLFLINPAGIIFGEGASLDIGGSFFGSTAESIVFPDGEFLATDADNTPLLTINMPIGLNFGNNPGEIAVNGSNLQVNNGEALALLGGEVRITGGEITAPGGIVELGGVAQQGQVSLNQQQSGEFGSFDSISFPEGIARADVTLTNGSEVDVRAAGGGSISVNARNIEISGGELGASNLFAGIAPESGSPEAQAGDITLNATDNITVTQGSRISNSVEESGVGNAGSVNITANDLVKFDRESTAFSRINSGAVGNAGSVLINTGFLEVTNGAQLQASTLGTGSAGTIIIEVTDRVIFDGESNRGFVSGAFSQVGSGASGNAGGIEIYTPSLTVSNGATLNTSIVGKGNGGTVKIEASDSVVFDGDSSRGFVSGAFSQVRPGASGNAGRIEIYTPSLTVSNGGLLSASNRGGKGNGGTVKIDASDSVVFDGDSRQGFVSGVISEAQGAVGDAGDIEIETTSLEVTNGAQLSASTFGEGKAGTVTIRATDRVVFAGKSSQGFRSGAFSAVLPEAVGNAKGIEIETASLEVTNGAQLSASTRGQGNAGTVEITANTFKASNGGQILSRTSSQSPAGNIILKVKDNITLSGSDTGIFTSTTEGSTGKGGSIIIDPRTLTIRDGATISVDSQGTGIGGDIELTAGFLTLDNGTISAKTRSNTGGDIILNLQDSLLLRNGSQISATAGNQEFGGNGGNININTPLIVALPNENSDITANAFNGSGGKIDITAQGIFGIEERSSTPANETNDLDARSEFGLDGTIAINEPDVNPAQALEELPTEVVDVARLVAQNLCQQGKGSEFIMTGKGGLAPSPTQARNGEINEVDLVEPATFSGDGEAGEIGEYGGDEEDGEEIVEAQGWIINDRGNIELIAYKTDPNGSPAQPKDAKICHK